MLGLTRKLLYNKPKKSDNTLLAQFYYADVELCTVAAELDSFDGRKNPARCAALVAQLRQYQDHVLRLIQNMMDDVIKDQRASRDFRIKYPEDLIQEGLAGQLWFGAECLAAGSSILNREIESESMRPLAKSLTKQLDHLRHALRDQSTRDPLTYTDKIKSAFVKFDRTFAEFELSYVSAMVPVKTMKEYDMSQEVTVLFSETVSRALSHGLITGDMLEYYDPELMFTIPRLAIVSGLVCFPQGPLNPDRRSQDMSELFRPFQNLLKRIRELLWTLNQEELRYLERLLCNLEQTMSKDQMPAPAQQSTKASHAPLENPANNHASSSLFNDISDVQDFTASSAHTDNAQNNRTVTDDFRTTLLDVLVGTSATDSQANNNVAESGDNSNNPSLSVQHSINPSATIVNDNETGIARLVISSAGEHAAAGQRQGSATTSRGRHVRRQQSAPSAQFAFNLPVASRIAVTDQASDEDTDRSMNTYNGPGPSRVTLQRSTSDARPSERSDGPVDLDSSTDTSTSSDSCPSDLESNSSDSRNPSPSTRRRQLLVQPFLDEKSQSLRRKYQSAQELLQKLFICISGVADQLQSNFACDLRNILKCVFDLHTADDGLAADCGKTNASIASIAENETVPQQSPPTWIPDSEMDKCCSCRLPFTLLRRRHHCRNCGLIFCARCSSNTAPLPDYGYERAVRICNKCYVYRINPFFMDDSTEETYNSASSRQQS